MTKTAIFLTALLATCAAYIYVLDMSSDQATDFIAIARHHQRVQELSVNYTAFKTGFDASLKSLRQGEIPLRDAQAQVHALALRYLPDYLAHLVKAEEGRTVEERVARNLVGHIRWVENIRPDPDSRLPLLERELTEFIAACNGQDSGRKNEVVQTRREE